MKIYLYLPLGGGSTHYKGAFVEKGECSRQLRHPYNEIFYTEGLYINADIYQKVDSGKRLQYADGDVQSFTSFQRIEVAGLDISKKEKEF